MTLFEEILEIEITKKKLREFGLLVGGIFMALAGFFWWRGHGSETVLTILVSAGAALFVCGLALPNSLKYPFKAWMTLALLLGWVVSRILLSVLFFLVVTPIGLVTRIMGKDFLDLKFRENRTSYWQLRKPEESSKEACERQF